MKPPHDPACSCMHCVYRRRQRTQQLLEPVTTLADALAFVACILLPLLAIVGVLAAWAVQP